MIKDFFHPDDTCKKHQRYKCEGCLMTARQIAQKGMNQLGEKLQAHFASLPNQNVNKLFDVE